ncbi:MAG: rubredoxin [Eubacteriales bacterium]
MGKYVCSICGYVYDEAVGIAKEGILPGTKWETIPTDWVCPLCGATKDNFHLEVPKEASTESKTIVPLVNDQKELSPLEISILCSNLSRGCEKQYLSEEAALFTEIADYFKGISQPEEQADMDTLLNLIEKDLNEVLPAVGEIAEKSHDRGALRALTWNGKVSLILKSLLSRYQQLGNEMVENTGVYVCTICGFIYVGDQLPELCPVCKVPNYKFEEVNQRITD